MAPCDVALVLNEEGLPLVCIKMDLVSGFTSQATKACTGRSVALESGVFSDGLACLSATAKAGCEHVVNSWAAEC